MEHKLAALTQAINAVDPGKLQRMYPTRDQFNRYLSLKREANDLLRMVVPAGLPDECENKLESLTKRLIELANEVAPTAELGGRLLVNHMVVWAETHHLERAIYLAGQCESLKVREPYRTQIKLQPANACMTRYRQIFKVEEWIRNNIQAELGGEIGQMLTGMLKALLNQFEFFAVEARRKNDRHVYATYMEALAYLFRAHECSAEGEDKVSVWLVKTRIMPPLEIPSRGQE